MASQITWKNRVPDSNQVSLAFHPNIQIAPLDTSLFQGKEFEDGMENGVGEAVEIRDWITKKMCTEQSTNP